jgi:hypothetical protein
VEERVPEVSAAACDLESPRAATAGAYDVGESAARAFSCLSYTKVDYDRRMDKVAIHRALRSLDGLSALPETLPAEWLESREPLPSLAEP